MDSFSLTDKDEKQYLSHREVQEILSGMLQQFASFCEENNLRYYLVGGTLLGAIRHKGFIPWDDDIDVGMPRPDYERFIELSKAHPFGDSITVLSGEKRTLSLPLAEMVNMEYAVERATGEYIEERYHVLNLFIDIIPQDGWPTSDNEGKKLFNRMQALRALCHASRSKLGRGSSIAMAIVKTPVVLLGKVLGPYRIVDKMIAEGKKRPYDVSLYVGGVTYGIYGLGEKCLRAEVVDFAEVEFEGRKYPAPGCWDSYLTGLYGDYMQIPSKEKQVSHGIKAYKVAK